MANNATIELKFMSLIDGCLGRSFTSKWFGRFDFIKSGGVNFQFILTKLLAKTFKYNKSIVTGYFELVASLPIDIPDSL